ncbi:MAG: DUF1284 domain-containing protein [Archaeoglobaceae archaeon]|nr:DUF1284 domain-containing protein [Archaeoglobales archaeon]MDI9642134.1 DUF1284 domain-containing protein [Archaeoglobales archaeon]
MHKLRGHHLICLHFFKAHGLDNEFQEALRRILSSISEVEVVEGIDEICEVCDYNTGVCGYSENSEEKIGELDRFALQKLGLKTGTMIKWIELKPKIYEMIEEWKDFACKNCEWRGACDV